MKNLSNKMSFFAISILMGAIIVSFVLTGFQGFGSNAGQVANVDGTAITSSEYNQALQFTINRYTQMLKAKSLSNKQIKDFRIRESTLQQLINQKHILNFASDLDFDAGKLNIKDSIKEYKVFQTGDKFDVNKYKSLLQANRLSPAKFEEDIINQIKTRKLTLLLDNGQDSKAFLKQSLRLKNLKMKSLAVSFDKEKMTEFLKVASSEIKTFVKDEKNDTLLKGLYKSYEAEHKAVKDQKKKVKTFTQLKKDLAKKHIQKSKRKELTAFNEKLVSDIKSALESSNTKKLSKLKRKYKINFDKNYELTPFKNSFMSSQFKEDDILELFKNKDTSKVITTDTPTSMAMAKAVTFEDSEVKEKDLENEIKSSAQRNGRLLESSILKHKEKNSKVVTSANLFL